MLRICLLLAVAVAVTPVALSSPPVAKTVSMAGAVVGLSADVNRVAIHTRTRGETTCDSGSVWTPATGQVVGLGTSLCTTPDQPGTGFAHITLAGSSAVWSRYDGTGESRCNGVYAVKLAKPAITRALFQCAGAPNESVGISGHGDILVVAYSDTQTLELDSVSSAKRKLILTLPGSDSLAGADAGRFLVAVSKSKLVVYSRTGAAGVSIPLADGAAASISGTSVVVRTGSKLTSYDAANGRRGITRAMPAGAVWQDIDGGLVVYSKAGALHLLNLASGRDRVIATVHGLVAVDLERTGLYYGWNDATDAAKPGNVTFLPTSAFPK